MRNYPSDLAKEELKHHLFPTLSPAMAIVNETLELLYREVEL